MLFGSSAETQTHVYSIETFMQVEGGIFMCIKRTRMSMPKSFQSSANFWYTTALKRNSGLVS